MLTVADLLAEPSLELTLAAGEAGLTNVIRAAHTSEQTNISPWLQGGELLMTSGLLGLSDTDVCRQYVESCLRSGTSGLVLGLGADVRYQDAPPELVQAAEEFQMPLLLLPDPIPFIAVTKWVFARLADTERREWQDAVAITRDLTAAASAPEPIAAIVTTWATRLGASVVVTDLSGAAIAAAGPDASAFADRARVQLGEASPTESPVSVLESAETQVFTLGASAPRGLLLLERNGEPRVRHTVAVLVSLLSLELDHRYAAGSPERIRRAQVVTQLLSSTMRPERGHHLASSIGLPAQPLRVAVVRALDGERSEELASTLSAGIPSAATRPRDGAVDLLAPDSADLMSALERAAPGRAIGVSAPSRVGDLHISARQAHSLSEVAVQLGRPVQAEESGATQLLLQLGSAEVLSAYSHLVLAPLEDIDHRERTQLVHTLEEWLRANGAWDPTAEALSVHRNTVRNRIAKVATILGRDLESADQRMELWLALQARAAVLQTRPA